MSGTPETTYAWRPGQVLKLAATLLLALARVIERLEPSALLQSATTRTERLGDQLLEALSSLVAENQIPEPKPLLHLFSQKLWGWTVIREYGSPLPPDWDPRPFLDGLVIRCMHPDGQHRMPGYDLVTEARKRLAGRVGLSQHELAWFCLNWQDERIPDWFRRAVESDEIIIVVTETRLRDREGFARALCMSLGRGAMHWRTLWLDEGLNRYYQVLVPDDCTD